MDELEIASIISEMDLEKLIDSLDEFSHYPKSKKEVFIKDLNLIFDYLKQKDSFLELNKGKCCATCDVCENADKFGWSFLAKNSKKYFSLIFEYNNSKELKDINTCLYFGLQNLAIQNDIENNYELIYFSEGSLKFENFLKPF